MPYFTPDLANPHSRGWSGGCHSPWRNSRSWLAIGVILLGILYDPKASALFGLTRSAGCACCCGWPSPPRSPWRAGRGWLAIGHPPRYSLRPQGVRFFGLTRYGGLCLLLWLAVAARVLRSDYAVSRTAYFTPCLVCDSQGLTIYDHSGRIHRQWRWQDIASVATHGILHTLCITPHDPCLAAGGH